MEHGLSDGEVDQGAGYCEHAGEDKGDERRKDGCMSRRGWEAESKCK